MLFNAHLKQASQLLMSEVDNGRALNSSVTLHEYLLMQAIKKETAQPSRLVTLHEYLLMQAAIFRQSKTARAIN